MSSIEQKHLLQKKTELEALYGRLTMRIEAVRKDLDRTQDSEGRLGLTDRLAELSDEREKVVSELATIEAALARATSRLYHNLPRPTYTRFVGREEELEWLKQRLSPTDRAWQVAITGIGGVGKTALALAVADDYRQRYHELLPDERFDAIVWVSAQEEVLTVQGRERADLPESILHTLEDVYTAIARVLDREDITRAIPEEQHALVEKALQRQRTLLVMDNMESVQDDRIQAFLRTLPVPTKAIITSREWIDVAAVRALTGLSPDDATRLILEEAATRDVTLDVVQQQRLYNLTSGLPLPIKLGIARMSAGESFATVARWLGDAVGDLPEYSVRGQVDLVLARDPNAWTVLLACSLFDRDAGASKDALSTIADLSLADRDQALAQLQRLFLVNRTEHERFWVLPIVQRYVSTKGMEAQTFQSAAERWLKWLVGFLTKHGPFVAKDLNALLFMEREYPNIRIAIQWCKERGLRQFLLQLCSKAWPLAYQTGLYNDLDDMLLTWLAAAQAESEQQSVGHAKLQLARLRWITGFRSQALEYLGDAEPILAKYADYTELAEAWATRCQILRAQDNLTEAEAWAGKIVELSKLPGNQDLFVTGALQSAVIAARRADYPRAFEWLDQAEVVARRSGSPRDLTSVLDRKANELIRQGNFPEAEPLLKESIAINSALRAHRYLAWEKALLARVYAQTDRLPAARDLAMEAKELGERLGLPETQKMAEQIFEMVR